MSGGDADFCALTLVTLGVWTLMRLGCSWAPCGRFGSSASLGEECSRLLPEALLCDCSLLGFSAFESLHTNTLHTYK